MARILLTATLFFLSFSPHLMAAEAHLKKTTSGLPTLIDDSQACKDAFEKCRKAHNSKDPSCESECLAAENECEPKPHLLKAKTDYSNTNYGRARNFRQDCQNKIKQNK